MGSFALHLCVCSLLVAVVLAQVPVPFNLQTSYLSNPLGIDTVSPRLSWSLTHPSKAQFQSAYRVVVNHVYQGASTVVWDTAQVKSPHFYTTYGSSGQAKPLQSASTYTWQVQWWDAQGNQSAWSQLATFGTGYISISEYWSASWIGGPGNLLRKEFSLSAVAANSTARVYVSGIGYYELYINGQRVGDSHLDVGWTDYAQRVYYSAYDVKPYLLAGNNAIGIMQGRGWYSSTYSKEPNGNRSSILQLAVDGKTVLVTDQTWTNSNGPIVYDDVYNGETYDARLEQPNWASVNFSTPLYPWNAALAQKAPGGILSFSSIPPIRILEYVSPKKVTNPANGTYVVDFGQNFSGWCRITIQAPANTNITLRHAEVLLKDGSGQIYVDNLRAAKATDTYIFKGAGVPEVYEPRFTYHGFRYVQITSSDRNVFPTLTNIIGVHAASDVQNSGSIQFVASSNVLNQIQHNILWGQASNLMSVPTDCDQRDERKGWMGDAQLSAEEAIHNFYMPAFYSNFLNVIEDEQGSDGTLTDTSPWTFGSRPADPAWGSAFPSILYWVWKYYDDIELVETHYASVKLYIEYLSSRHSSSGLRQMFYNYGDWVPPAPIPMCSSHLTSSFSYMANILQFIEMAEALGNTADVTNYTSLYTKLSDEFNTAFFNSTTSFYDTGLQTAQALALFLDIVPETSYRTFISHLLNDIVSTHETHLTTGIIGTKYLMLVLHNIGRDDIALSLAENFDYPSWGYMAYHPTEPATTLWELWNTPNGNPGMDSRNHIMFGSVGDWFYKVLAGIDHGDFDTGFAEFNIAPAVVGDLQSVSATFVSGKGNISVAWQKQGGDMVCGSAPEGHMITLDCSSIGSTGSIKEIVFAGFGTPRGTCGSYGEDSKCHTRTAHSMVESQCLGQKSCTFLAHENVLGAASCGSNVFKRLHVQARCSVEAATTFNLQAGIPVGSVANVVLPSLGLSNVQVSANGVTIWSNNKYTGGAAGITGGVLTGTTLSFVTGSGSYDFKLSGSQGVVRCFNTTENFQLDIACPAGTVITQVQFASFGTPYGECGTLFVGDCNAGSSKYLTEYNCLLRNSCAIDITSEYFGDPCYDTPKSFVTQVVCGKI